MQRQIGREEPLVSDGVFSRRLPVEGVDPAARTGHRGHHAVARIAPVVVGHPRMDVSGPCAHLPVAAQVIPREDAAERTLALAVFELGVVGIVGRQQRQFAVRTDIPRIQSEAVAAAGVVVDLLQHVHVVERTAAVPLHRIVRTDDMHVVVVDVLLLVAVAVLVVVLRRLIDGTGRDLPVRIAPREAQKLVEGAVHADSLNVLKAETVGRGGHGREFHHAAERPARFVHRRGPVQQRGIVDEVRRNHREVGHAEHRVVDAHAVPRNLRMRRPRAAERDRRKRRTAVLLDE